MTGDDKLFETLPHPAQTPRAVLLLTNAADNLDAAGHTTVPIRLFTADYRAVKKHLGLKGRTKVVWRCHDVQNGGPKFRRNKP